MAATVSPVYERLLDYTGTLRVIDTHEHLPPFEANDPRDVLSIYPSIYLSSDLVSAGLPAQTLNTLILRDGVPLMEKWQALQPYWDYTRHTGYGRAVARAAADLYGIDRIDGDSIEALNERFMAARAQGGRYRHVLADRCHIEAAILDCWCDEADPETFRIATQVAPLVYGENGNLWQSIQQRIPCTLATFDDLLDAVTAYVEDRLTHTAVCLKCSLAYERSIHFPRTAYADAAADLQRMRASDDPAVWKSCTHLQNYMMHHVLATVNRQGGIVQFHTGLQEGNGNHLEWTNPILLTNLFMDYPDVTFDLFHIGYPFQNITAALCKNFPNVMIDMCWAHIISPFDAVRALHTFLDTVPYNKISGFGGDYSFEDGTYGHLCIARENIAQVLAEKVGQGRFDEAEARHIAKHLLYDNPKRIFRL